MKWSLVDVREAPAAFSDDVIALVSFNYEPDQFAGPLEVTRYSAKNKKEYVVAKIVGASVVSVIDAQLRKGEKGPWLTTNPIGVPDDVKRDVAKTVADRMKPAAPKGAEFDPKAHGFAPGPTRTGAA